jgi:hypothetical protein
MTVMAKIPRNDHRINENASQYCNSCFPLLCTWNGITIKMAQLCFGTVLKYGLSWNYISRMKELQIATQIKTQVV